MPAFILGLLPALKKHWKLIAAAVGVLAVFLAGWTINGTRWENRLLEERTARQEAVIEAVEAAQKKLMDDFRAYGGDKVQYEFINLYEEEDEAIRNRRIGELYQQCLSIIHLICQSLGVFTIISCPLSEGMPD